MLYKQIYNAQDCIHTDKLIKAIQEEMTKPNPSRSINELRDNKIALEQFSAQQLCSDKIETQRQLETALLITKTAIEQEKKVLGNSKKEENIYIGVGALILIVGLIILIKK
jgi:hypothetical protein